MSRARNRHRQTRASAYLVVLAGLGVLAATLPAALTMIQAGAAGGWVIGAGGVTLATLIAYLAWLMFAQSNSDEAMNNTSDPRSARAEVPRFGLWVVLCVALIGNSVVLLIRAWAGSTATGFLPAAVVLILGAASLHYLLRSTRRDTDEGER